MGKKKKNGRFALKRAGGEALKSTKTEKTKVKKSETHKEKEVKIEDKASEIRKAIIPIEESEEKEIENNGLSEDEVNTLKDVENLISEKVEESKDTSTKRVKGCTFPELKKNRIIELTPDSRYNIFNKTVSKIKTFKSETFVRISNGSTQYKIFSKAIENVYLKEVKYTLKTVPYLHVIRGKEIFEIKLCSEIMNVDNYVYFVVVEISKKNKINEIQKVILLDTDFVLR